MSNLATIVNNILADSGIDDINVVVSTGSYANPAWITSLAWTKITGAPTIVGSVTASSPLFSSGGTSPNLTIQQASGSQNGFLSSTDWTTFNNKQPAGNYITSLTGEATASGPGAASVTLLNSAVIGKVLTGLNVTGGTVVSTDNILAAFGKVQNQINGLIGGSIFQGVWNASTNTPTLTSSVGTNGYYYIVSVAGATNLNGITDWKVGDWAIFAGTTWQKVDNTDAVSSVNGFTGAVSLTTSNISEGTNLYYTEARVNANTNVAANTAARHNAVTLGTANGLSLSTQILSLGLASAGVTGALSGTDWTTFNNKENAITAGTTAQYYRGDKTFQTLNTAAVPELTNLYFTTARVLDTALTGYTVGANTALAATDTILAAFGKVQGQINAKGSGTVTSVGGTGTVNGLTLTGTVTTTGNLTLGGTLAIAATQVTSGTLPITRGGTGATTTIQGGVVYGASTSEYATTAASTSGYVLTSGGTGAPSFLINDLTLFPSSNFKKSVRAATTANITLSAPQTIDGIACVAGNRVLVKNQTTTSQNGIYVVNAAAWTRPLDANASNEITSAVVAVDEGTVNGGALFKNYFKATDVVGTTAMLWYNVVDTSYSVAAGSTKTDGAYVGYTGTTNTASYFNGGTTTPTGTTRLNYSGYFYPTFLNLVGSGDTTTAATHYFVETGTDGFVRPKTLANVRTEVVGGFTGNFSTTALLYSTVSSTASNFKIPFLNTTGTASGNFELLHDSAATFTYNPSTDTLAAGAATFTSSVTAAFLGIIDSSGQVGNINSTNANGGYLTWQTSGTTIADLGTAQQVFGAGGNDTFGINARGARSLILGTNNTARLTINSAGAATFSSSVSVGDFLRLTKASSVDIQAYTGSAYSNLNYDAASHNWQTSGGTAKMVLTSGGNVGIGTTTPEATGLTIAGGGILVSLDTGAARKVLELYATSTGAKVSSTYVGASSYGSLELLTSNLPRLTITSAGNVGIGTDSALQTLTLAGTQMMYNTAGDGNVNTIIGSITSQVRNYGVGIASSSFASIQFSTDPTTWFKGDIRFLTNGSDGTASAGSERMRITSAGNVGIGTINATGQSADNRVIQIYGAGTANRSQIHFVNVNTGETATDGSFIGIDSSSELFIINRENAATVFENNGTQTLRITASGVIGFNGSSAIGNAGLDKMSMGYLNSNYGWIQTWNGTPLVLNASGNNVLIGTTTSTGAKLEVNGDVVASNYKTTSGSLSVPSATYTTVFTFNNSDNMAGVFTVRFAFTNASTICFFTKTFDGGNTKLTVGSKTSRDGSDVISVSENGIQVYHNTGVAVTAFWSFTRTL